MSEAEDDERSPVMPPMVAPRVGHRFRDHGGEQVDIIYRYPQPLDGGAEYLGIYPEYTCEDACSSAWYPDGSFFGTADTDEERDDQDLVEDLGPIPGFREAMFAALA